MRPAPRTRAVAALAALWLTIPASTAAQDRFFDANGVSIRYVEKGQGEAVVLLHGIGGSLQAWIASGVFDALAANYHVIAFDARGHGRSGKPHDPNQYGREMALDVVRLLDHVKVRQAHIVGYSMGAMTTSQLLTLHPERFVTATLAAAAGRFQMTPDDDRLAEQEASERERECVSRTLIDRLTPIGAPKRSDSDMKQLSDECFADRDHDRFAIAALTRARRDTIIAPERAAAVTVPTLGIVGTLDPLRTTLEELKSMRPSLRLVFVERAVHSAAAANGLMRTPQFLATLRAFLASRGQRTTHD